MDHAEDRRHFHRIPFHGEVVLHHQGHTAIGRLLDISLKGLLVTRPVDWSSTAEAVDIALNLPDSRCTLAVTGHVRHEDRDYLGVEIEQLDLDSMSHLKRLVAFNSADPALLERELAELIRDHAAGA